MDKIVESSRTLDMIISSIGDLPATPAIISTLMSLTADLNADIDKISRAISSDQSLTARVLKLSNSSFYGRTKEVRTLNEAILLLGFKTLRSMVVASSTHSLYQSTGSGDAQEKLWEHSLATAIASRLVAASIRHPLAEEAFIAGLLHDIGKLVLLQKRGGEYKDIIAGVESSGETFLDVEDEVFGFNHTDVGLLLLHKWSFPQILANAVFEHHEPIDAESDVPPLSFIIHFGNHVAKRLDIGFNDTRVEDLTTLPSMARLGLTPEALETLEPALAEQFDYEKEILAPAAA